MDDEKVKLLAFEDRWHFIAILCCKRKGMLDEPDDAAMRDRKVGAKLGLADRERDEVRRRLVEVRLIDEDWQPLAWDRRQYVSDTDPTAAERKRKQRERERHAPVTRESRTSHAPQRQITDTDTEKNKKGAPAPLVFPNGFAVREWEEWIAHRKTRRMPTDRRTLQKQIDALAPYGYDEQREMINRSINAGWQGLFPVRGNVPRETTPTRSTWRPTDEDSGPC